MIFASYEQWRDSEQKHLLETNPMVPCNECDGQGVTECDECGHEKDCEECDSSGEMRFADVGEHERKDYLTREKYEQALLQDAESLARWLGREMSEILVSCGFQPWQSVIYQQFSGETTGFRGGAMHVFR